MSDTSNVTDLDSRREVEPRFKESKMAPPAAKKATSKKATAAKKATAKKSAPPAAKKTAGNTQRTASTVSKEGTQKDSFTGETLPVTAFPTVRQKDGSYVRGTVARKNLAAWRESKRSEREAAKAAAAQAKANKAKEKKSKEGA